MLTNVTQQILYDTRKAAREFGKLHPRNVIAAASQELAITRPSHSDPDPIGIIGSHPFLVL